MTDTSRSTVIAAFPSIEQADAAVSKLLRSGFKKEEVGLIVRDNEEIKKLREREAAGNAAAIRVVEGGVGGGVLAGLLGSLAALAFPGFGPVLSAGLLAGVGGAIAGSFAGLMSTFELSDEEIRWFEGELEAGRPIVAVRTDGRYSEALAILQVQGGYDMSRVNVEESK